MADPYFVLPMLRIWSLIHFVHEERTQASPEWEERKVEWVPEYFWGEHLPHSVPSSETNRVTIALITKRDGI